MWKKENLIPKRIALKTSIRQDIKRDFLVPKNKTIISTVDHNKINFRSYFYNFYFATTYLNLRVTDNLNLI